jgi:hypothetical protein
MIKSKMSLNQTVTKAVNEVINKFIKNISTKYDLDPNELLAEWEDNKISTKPIVNKSVVNKSIDNKSVVNKSIDNKSLDTDIPDNIDQNTLSQYKKTELQDLCRKRSLKCTGTKEQLIGFLLGKDATISEKPTKKEETAKQKIISTPVAKKLTSSIPTVAIRRNQYGNHEHPDTSFVFDKKTKKAIGKQNEDGTVEDLTEDDIDICNQWKFSYILPNNLDKKTKDVKVEELDDEDEILESDEEEVQLEEDELAEDELIDEEEEFEEEFEEEEDLDYE